MGRAKHSNRRQQAAAQIGYTGAIGDEVTGIDPALLESESEDPDSLELDGLYVDDIPRESRAAEPAPGPRPKKRRKKGASGKRRAAERRREREPDIDEEPEGPETTTALPQPESELGLSGTGPSGKLSYAAGVLQCTRGPEEGLALNLIEGSYTIGRARENNFVLKDIAASREHLRIVVENNIVKAVDLGSGNGTRVNGEKIGEVPLKNGDRIEIGNSCLVFTYLGRDRSTSLPNAPQNQGKNKSKSKKSAPAPPAPPDRPPTQERIVMAAEKLAAELSERFRREDDGLDELPATSMERSISNPRVTSPHEAFEPQDSFVEDDDMAAAIQQMAREVSAPNDELGAAVPEEEWADSETATRLPLGAEAAAARGYGGGGLPPPMPGGPSGAMPAVSHSYVVKAADVDRGSPLLMMLVAMLITVLIAAGGVLGYLQYSGRVDLFALAGLSKTAEQEMAEQTAELRKAALDAEKAAYKMRDDNPDAWAAATVASLIHTQDDAKLKELNAFLTEKGKEPVPMPPAYVAPQAAGENVAIASGDDGDKAPGKSGDAAASDTKAGRDKGDDAKAAPSKGGGEKVAAGDQGKATNDDTGKPTKAGGAKGEPANAKAASSSSAPSGKTAQGPKKVAKAPSKKDPPPAKSSKAGSKSAGSKTASAKRASPSKSKSPGASKSPGESKAPAASKSKPRKAEKRAAKPKRSPPPKPERESATGDYMDDSRAAGLYKKAILAIKKDNAPRACKFLKLIKSQAAPDSVWRTKAKMRMERSCQ